LAVEILPRGSDPTEQQQQQQALEVSSEEIDLASAEPEQDTLTDGVLQSPSSNADSEGDQGAVSAEELRAELCASVEGALAMKEFMVEKKTKRTQKRKMVDLRANLLEMSVSANPQHSPLAGMYPPTPGTAVINVTGTANPLLTPDAVRSLLEAGSGNKWRFELRAVHRNDIILKEPPPIPVEMGRMRSWVHAEAYQALNRRYGRRESDGALIEK